MSTESKASFDENWATITDLMSLTGDGVTTHPQRAARNKAAMVFCITAWESYVEDLACEGARYLADHCPTFDDLPTQTKRSLELAVTPSKGPGTQSPSGKYPRAIAGDGWRLLLVELVEESATGQGFNTPSSKNVKNLFTKWFSIDVTESWAWKGFARPGPARRLDESISLRGEIVHRGGKPNGLNQNWVYTYGEVNIRQLVAKTDDCLIGWINSTTKDFNPSVPFGISAPPIPA